MILLVDASRLAGVARSTGLFQPVKSDVLDKAIPAAAAGQGRHRRQSSWLASTRARVIAYDKARSNPQDVATYEMLADPVNKGRICIRSGSHPYNLSLFGSVMEHLGEKATETWLRGIVANLARAPRGRHRPAQGGGLRRMRRRGPATPTTSPA